MPDPRSARSTGAPRYRAPRTPTEHALAVDARSGAELWRTLAFGAPHNTRVVMAGTMVLGLACGAIGSLMLLRRRSLMADALSHATLPGIALTFILITYWGGEGKNLIAFIAGAALF